MKTLNFPIYLVRTACVVLLAATFLFPPGLSRAGKHEFIDRNFKRD